jgi:hypothetical protein
VVASWHLTSQIEFARKDAAPWPGSNPVNAPSIADLAGDAEREFLAALGTTFIVSSRETFFESSYRGGFELILTDPKNRCEIVYSDMELEVRCNGTEVFGTAAHEGFEGNMFSREHLREYLPRIAASAANTARLSHGLA